MCAQNLHDYAIGQSGEMDEGVLVPHGYGSFIGLYTTATSFHPSAQPTEQPRPSKMMAE